MMLVCLDVYTNHFLVTRSHEINPKINLTIYGQYAFFVSFAFQFILRHIWDIVRCLSVFSMQTKENDIINKPDINETKSTKKKKTDKIFYVSSFSL